MSFKLLSTELCRTQTADWSTAGCVRKKLRRSVIVSLTDDDRLQIMHRGDTVLGSMMIDVGCRTRDKEPIRP